MNLTDANVRNLKPKNGKAERLVAGGNGLYLRVRGNGPNPTRTWQYRRKKAGRPTIVPLGTYPLLSVREARLKANELALKGCVDSPTVQEAVTQWLCEQVDGTHKRADLIRGYLDRCIIPQFGQRKVRDVRPVDIAKAVRAYRDIVAMTPRGRRAAGQPAARALLGVWKGLFQYCTDNGWIDRSPAAQVPASVVGPAQSSRNRTLTDDEIRSVMTESHSSGAVMRFLLLTGLRIGEAYSGHRDGQTWVVPKEAAKNRREHKVWLSRLALAQLEYFPWIAARGSVQRRLKDSGAGWTAHDLRRTFATRLNTMGIAPYVVERCLNHTLGGVMQVYNRADYEDERRAALEKWSTILEGMSAPVRDAQVVEIHSSKVADRHAA